MIPAPVTDEMVKAFSLPLEVAVKRMFEPASQGDDDMTTYDACEAVVHRSPTDGVTAVVRVPMDLEPHELTHLLNGGRVWVSMWGGLLPFAVEVVASPDDAGQMPNAQKALHQRETEATALAAERAVS